MAVAARGRRQAKAAVTPNMAKAVAAHLQEEKAKQNARPAVAKKASAAVPKPVIMCARCASLC
jgi:hypothetical protein